MLACTLVFHSLCTSTVSTRTIFRCSKHTLERTSACLRKLPQLWRSHTIWSNNWLHSVRQEIECTTFHMAWIRIFFKEPTLPLLSHFSSRWEGLWTRRRRTSQFWPSRRFSDAYLQRV